MKTPSLRTVLAPLNRSSQRITLAAGVALVVGGLIYAPRFITSHPAVIAVPSGTASTVAMPPTNRTIGSRGWMSARRHAQSRSPRRFLLLARHP